jgi:hypothetical protein
MIHRTREMALPALLIAGSLVLAFTQVGCASQASQDDTQPATEVAPPSSSAAEVAWTPDELNQLVAPIALYPDALIAQVVAAASFPSEIVEADRWMQANAGLNGAELAKAADSQSWDTSVKALTQFPSVLAMMDKNLSWTSALGEADVNQPQNVLEAVQVMRGRAQQAGNLQSTPQESVTTAGQSIEIQPADPDVVYVPEYDPWDVYGEPLELYPDWVGGPGAFVGPGIEFGLGIGVGVFGGFGWGWHHWGADWHGREVLYNHNTYMSHSPTFDHSGFGHPGGFGRPGGFDHPGGFAGREQVGAGGAAGGDHSSAFSGFNHGGVANTYSSRGRSSVGGASHGGGGGSHGGGFHAGGNGGGFHGGASHGGGHR